jgi:hypothetical protein
MRAGMMLGGGAGRSPRGAGHGRGRWDSPGRPPIPAYRYIAGLVMRGRRLDSSVDHPEARIVPCKRDTVCPRIGVLSLHECWFAQTHRSGWSAGASDDG